MRSEDDSDGPGFLTTGKQCYSGNTVRDDDTHQIRNQCTREVTIVGQEVNESDVDVKCIS